MARTGTHALLRHNLRQVTQLTHKCLLSPTKQYTQGVVTLSGWEGNRRSGITLAMQKWFIHLRAHGLRKGDEHPAYIPHGLWHTSELEVQELEEGVLTVVNWK